MGRMSSLISKGHLSSMVCNRIRETARTLRNGWHEVYQCAIPVVRLRFESCPICLHWADIQTSCMLIALIYQTSNSSPPLYAAEVYIILTFGHGSSMTSATLFEWRKDTSFTASKYDNMTATTLLGILTRLFITSAFEGYMIWYWFVGIEGMTSPENPSCVSYAWFFSRVRLLGWFRTLNKVGAVMGATGCFYDLAKWTITIATSINKRGWRWIAGRLLDSLADERDEIHNTAKLALHIASRHHRRLVLGNDIEEAQLRIERARNGGADTQESLESMLHARNLSIRRTLSPNAPNPPLPGRRWVLVTYLYISESAPWVWDFGVLSIFIAGIEMTIRYNDIKGVSSYGSTGQLIPFVTGIAGLVKVWLEYAKAKRKRILRRKRRQKKKQDDQAASGQGGQGEAVQVEAMVANPTGPGIPDQTASQDASDAAKLEGPSVNEASNQEM